MEELTIAIVDTSVIRAALDDPDVDVVREAVVPLLLDLRNLAIHGVQFLARIHAANERRFDAGSLRMPTDFRR